MENIYKLKKYFTTIIDNKYYGNKMKHDWCKIKIKKSCSKISNLFLNSGLLISKEKN